MLFFFFLSLFFFLSFFFSSFCFSAVPGARVITVGFQPCADTLTHAACLQTGSGYLGAHVFVQQYLCLPCHPMISCMIDESTSTLRIPLEFAKKLADKMEDFDRTGLKVKIGEEEPDNGPLRQDELYIPSQYFAMQRGSGGGPAPPFPPPNCANNADPFPGVDAEEGSTVLGYWPSDDCPDVGEVRKTKRAHLCCAAISY